MCYQAGTFTWYFNLGVKVAREGHKDLCLGGKQRVELASPNFLSPEYTLENSGDIPCCSSTFLSRGHFYRDTGLEENPGPSWTSWPGSSLLENPESSGPRRSHSWESKGVTISKSCKKSE